MRIFHLLWLPVLGLAQTGCTGDVFIATTSDSGVDPAPGKDAASSDGGGGGAGDSGGGHDASMTDAQPGSGACTTASDCAASQLCGFLESPACPSSGQCFTVPPVECLAYSAGCACDGTEIDVGCTGLPSGYSTKPLRHTGACGDASPPATDARAPCTANSDCGSQEVCAFPAADGCAAQGQCVAEPSGAICNSILPGCACDGSEINLACNGLPTGYETKPVRHTGMCAADGG